MTGTSPARGILAQARPILVGQLAVMAFAVVDTVLTGHASAVDLATMGLGLSVYSLRSNLAAILDHADSYLDRIGVVAESSVGRSEPEIRTDK